MNAAMTDSSMPELKAVFFDLGGTLFQHLPAAITEQNLLATLEKYAADTHSGTTNRSAYEAAVRIYKQHRRQAEAEGCYQAFFIHRRMVAEALRRTLTDLNVPAGNAASEFCDAQRVSVTTRLELRPDTLCTLSELRRLDMTTAIVSNIDDDYIVPLLARTDLGARVDFCISSERARSCKPHAGIFRQALAQVEHDPQHILFVGDSYTNDVLGARRLGMQTALLTADLSAPWPSGADYYIGELAELLDIVSQPQQR